MQVLVEGLRELRRALTAADDKMPVRLREELKGVAGRVAVRAKAKLDADTVGHGRNPGSTGASIRPVAFRGGAGVRAGGARTPWYGWLDFGGTIRHHGANHSHAVDHLLSRPYVGGGRYLFPALDEQRATLELETERVLDRVFAEAGWGV